MRDFETVFDESRFNVTHKLAGIFAQPKSLIR
jgi:hypothetical protein